MSGHVERDAVTGQETTGHEWDGIKELNTPLPKWWLYILYATVAWSVAIWVLYPAWPSISGYTRGVLGYSTRQEFAADAAAQAADRQVWTDRLAAEPVDRIVQDPELLAYAMAGGRAVFAENCAACHGAGGQGRPGYPVLADDSWLWGGTIDEIYRTVQYGIRAGHPETLYSEMPRFGADQLLTAAQIRDVGAYVQSLTGPADAEAAVRGAPVFAQNCAVCHGDAGQGSIELGAPALNDAIWLYGGGLDRIIAQISAPRHGVMPAWTGRLDDATLKMVSVYVHALGGGQ